MKYIGFFDEMKLYNNNGPVSDFLVEKINYDKDRVCQYLENQKVVAICAKYAIDCVSKEIINSGFKVLTDDEYTWPDFLIYHIENYNISLPEDFVRKIMN